MRVRRSLPPALLAALLVALPAVAGCTGEDPAPPASNTTSPTSPPAPAEPAPRPRAGTCHAMSRAQALSPVAGGRQVPCARRHTAQTFRVGTLDLVDDGDPLAVDSPAAQRQPRRACTAALPAYVGASARELRLSMVRTIWFTPTVEEAAAGADWYRCDVVALGVGERLAPLPRSARGMLSRSPRPYAVCGTAEPGTDRFARVPCSARHSWVAVSTVDLRGAGYPTGAAVSEQMSEACRGAARDRADDPLDFSWAEERPTRQQWESGQRWGTCWAPAG
ncbi:hypothetical protein DDE18_09240 [Nocardioides gansuensis]|uniref:Septum formation-related domain-containing protein n=2 Tax=Nocardioides gansuensis TaxID=2138300 RepID=A0A2T8FCN2_9ACTN|nr:hypothetical protein DDE18_09240 [Nocardioides gansuensis]